MADDELRYDRMVEDALRSVVSKALSQVAERGLSGDHHFYITFRTDHPDLVIPDQLRARYPSEMTIVLQHQFWGLEVGPDAFGITLSFSNVPEHLTIPFESVVAFADPSVRFGLQFDVGADEQKMHEDDKVVLGEAAPPEVEAANLMSLRDHRDSAGESGAGESGAGESGAGESRAGESRAAGDPPAEGRDKVVTLDAFRKVDALRKK